MFGTRHCGGNICSTVGEMPTNEQAAFLLRGRKQSVSLGPRPMENPQEMRASGKSRESGGLSLAPRRRVLIVDDNLDYSRTMTQFLRAMGHDADFAINATVALSVARSFRPDTILLDITLPDGDGRLLAG